MDPKDARNRLKLSFLSFIENQCMEHFSIFACENGPVMSFLSFITNYVRPKTVSNYFGKILAFGFLEQKGPKISPNYNFFGSAVTN